MFFRKARHVHFLYKHTYSHVDTKRTQLYAWKTYMSSFLLLLLLLLSEEEEEEF